MRRRYSRWALAAAACGGLLVSGCSTVETRISEHPEIYQHLSPSDQQLVQNGQIRPGMSQDAVYLAWGGPQQKSTANIRGKFAETWIYYSSTATGGYGYWGYPYPAYGPYFGAGFYGRGRYYRRFGHRYYGWGYDLWDPFFIGGTQIVNYPYKTISFEHRRVVAFQFLARPNFY